MTKMVMMMLMLMPERRTMMTVPERSCGKIGEVGLYGVSVMAPSDREICEERPTILHRNRNTKKCLVVLQRDIVPKDSKVSQNSWTAMIATSIYRTSQFHQHFTLFLFTFDCYSKCVVYSLWKLVLNCGTKEVGAEWESGNNAFRRHSDRGAAKILPTKCW